MTFKKLGLLSLFALMVTFAFTTPAAAQDLSNKNWRVFNINPDVPKLWDINQAQSLNTGGVGFTFNQLSTGWFTVYLNINFIDLTGKTSIIANSSWTASTQYVNRFDHSQDAHFRVYFQSAQGNYDSSDYWWSTDSCNLNDPTAALGCNLTVPLNDRAHWTNLCGQSATDHFVYPSANCVGGIDKPSISPYDGFTRAMRNVKDVGLSFGRSARYASGVANGGTGSASFQLNSFGVF
ncbi:MAG: hypothetical protein QOH41_2570 [Blastocatellia bacterium]|nr:hypothetical protein [Blastocatellia bacterium]